MKYYEPRFYRRGGQGFSIAHGIDSHGAIRYYAEQFIIDGDNWNSVGDFTPDRYFVREIEKTHTEFNHDDVYTEGK